MQPRYVFTRPIVTRCLWLAITLCLTVLITACGGGGGGGDPTTGTAVDETPAISTAVRLDQGLGGFMEVGSPVVGKVTATAVDKRNSVTGYTIINPTVGGGAVTVSPDGTVQWTPNAVDFNTTALTLSVRLDSGSAQNISLPVVVRASSIKFEATLKADQIQYSDLDGNISLRVGTIDGSPPSGNLIVTEFYDRDGNLSYRAKASNTKVLATFLDAPRYRVVSNSVLQTQSADAAPSLADVTYRLGIHAGGQKATSNCNLEELFTTRFELITDSYYKPCVYQAYNSPIEFRTWEPVSVIRIDATCHDSITCKKQGSPVILIHGFEPTHTLGGGAGTWGTLASELNNSAQAVQAQHDVFEFRWITHMRFEEAAGQLANLTRMVAGITGKKPVIIAHSFGGVVSHLALADQGVVWRNGRWEKQTGIGSMVKRLITLGSPIGGISKAVKIEKFGVNQQPMTFAQGRDSDDPAIQICTAITCVQAGAFDRENSRNIYNILSFSRDLRDNLDVSNLSIPEALKAIADAAQAEMVAYNLASSPGDKSKITAGESIFRLAQNSHSVSTSIVVGVNSDEYNMADTPAKDLGDGLISMIGQVHPSDQITFSIGQIAAGSPESMFRQRGSANREYFFLPGGAHTGFHANSVLMPVKEALYEGAQISYCEGQRFEPLAGLINSFCRNQRISKQHIWTMNSAPYSGSGQIGLLREEIGPIPNTLKPWKSTFTVLSPCPLPLICTQADSAVAVLPVTVELRRKDTGIRVSASRYYTDAAGKAEPDLNTLADTSALDFNRADYQVRITMGDGVTYEIKTVVVDDLIADLVQVPNIILQRKGASGTGTATGRVVDQAGRPIANAMVTLRAGVNLGVGDFVAVAPSTTARVVYTDANGNFAASGLRATEFTVRVRGGTFLQKLQPGVIVPAGGTASQDYIVTATSCVAPLSLQNGGCIGAVTALIAPTLIMPSATITTPNPILTWSGGANADHYEIFVTDLTDIGANNGMPFRLAMFVAPLSNFLIPNSLAVGHQYRWEIRACPDIACTSGYVTSNQIVFIPFAGSGGSGSPPPPAGLQSITATINGNNYIFRSYSGEIFSYANNGTWQPSFGGLDSAGNQISLMYCAVERVTVISYCGAGSWFIRFFDISTGAAYDMVGGQFNTTGSHALGEAIGTFSGSLVNNTSASVSGITGSFFITGLPIIAR